MLPLLLAVAGLAAAMPGQGEARQDMNKALLDHRHRRSRALLCSARVIF